jgi:signal transduction histidine kinase
MTGLRRATLQLTIKYSLVFFAFIWLFSGGIYLWVNNSLGEGYVDRINSSLEQQHSSPMHQAEISDSAAGLAVDITLGRLRNILLFVNLAAVFGIPLAAYLISKRTLVPLIESQKSQQRFVANASHELRTPLALMLTELDWADKKERSLLDYKATITNTKHEVQHMTTLVKSLLMLARLSDRAMVMKTTVKVDPLIREVIEYYKAVAKERSLQITTDLHAQTIRGDEDLIHIVLSNLVDNAVKYARPHTAIHIVSKVASNNTIVEISNNTEALTKEQLGHFFDRFYQSDAHQAEEGFGLGLAIVKQIMEAHRGVIEAKLQADDLLEVKLIF